MHKNCRLSGRGRIVAPAIGAVAEEITAAIAASIDEYRQPMGGAFGRGVRLAIDSALRQFVEQIGQPAAGVRPGREDAPRESSTRRARACCG